MNATKLLRAALAFTTAWAVLATFQWWSMAQKLARPSSPILDESVAELEKTAFLRQFVHQYLNYDETTYWKNHTALAFLMTPELRDTRLAELNSRRDRRHQASFAQKAGLERIQKVGGGYRAYGALEGREERQTWRLHYEMTLALREIPRTIENPWGLEIARFDLKTDKAPMLDNDLTVALAAKGPTLFSFPCYVDQMEAPTEYLQIKIISLKDSEVQFIPKKTFDGEMNASAFCNNKKFLFKIVANAARTDAFLDVDASRAVARETSPRRKRGHEVYEKTLEQELGFIVGD